METVVLQRKAGGRADRVKHGGLLERGAVVDKGADPLAGPFDRRHRSSVVPREKGYGSTLGVPVAGQAGVPGGELGVGVP